MERQALEWVAEHGPPTRGSASSICNIEFIVKLIIIVELKIEQSLL